MRVNTTGEITAAYPQFRFESADEFCYDAAADVIYFDERTLESESGRLSLLHEIAHAELAHFDFQTDFELFAMETRAWARTRDLAHTYGVDCSEQFIIDCLTSYADWVTERATCPACENFSLQQDATTYRCFRCQTRWHIETDAKNRVRRVKL
jgi:DNA-directed RNA polymerase subunit RPC12/RpoP